MVNVIPEAIFPGLEFATQKRENKMSNLDNQIIVINIFVAWLTWGMDCDTVAVPVK